MMGTKIRIGRVVSRGMGKTLTTILTAFVDVVSDTADATQKHIRIVT